MEAKSDITTEENCCEFFREELKRCYREREQAFRRKQTRRFKG